MPTFAILGGSGSGSLAAVFDRQPALHDYIADLPYRRVLDLITELTLRLGPVGVQHRHPCAGQR
jgi:hypothetical protein